MSPRRDAEAIWQAGVAAVDSSLLVRNAVRCRATTLEVCGEAFDLTSLDRLIVVGAGKAGAGMALGLETALGSRLLDTKVTGWINVPADCVRPLHRIHLHAARPAGLNEPTAAGVFGSERILELVASQREHDLCLVLISGGGSALLPLPLDGIRLADKQAVTRHLSRAGATIHELNAVRKRLSRIKGGGLLRAATAGRMIALIISDVIGDPLDVIASGPTVCDDGTAADAIDVLNRFTTPMPGDPVPASVRNVLRAQAECGQARELPRISCRNVIVGNNETALNAALAHAKSLGFEVRSLGAGRGGIARDVGVELAELCLAARRESLDHSICFIGGGEPEDAIKSWLSRRPADSGTTVSTDWRFFREEPMARTAPPTRPVPYAMRSCAKRPNSAASIPQRSSRSTIRTRSSIRRTACCKPAPLTPTSWTCKSPSFIPRNDVGAAHQAQSLLMRQSLASPHGPRYKQPASSHNVLALPCL